MDETDTGKDPKTCCQCKERPGVHEHLDDPWCSACWDRAKQAEKQFDARMRRTAGMFDTVMRTPPLGKCHMATCDAPADFRSATGDLWCDACWANVQAPKAQAPKAQADMNPDAQHWLEDIVNEAAVGVREQLDRDAPEPPAVDERMDKLPPRGLLWAARAMGHGMKYEDEEAGWADWLARTPAHHLNRAMRHIALYLAGDTSEDHPGHIIGRILMWGDRLAAEAEEGA